MYMGHIGIALAGAGARPAVPVGALVLASLASDLLDAAAGLAGLDSVYAWTHSLPAGVAIGAVAALVYVAVTKDRLGAGVVGLVGASHVLADLSTSRLPAWPGGPTVGLHLYRFDSVDFALEAGLVVLGWVLYRQRLTAEQRRTWPVWAMLGSLIVFQAIFQALPIS